MHNCDCASGVMIGVGLASVGLAGVGLTQAHLNKSIVRLIYNSY